MSTSSLARSRRLVVVAVLLGGLVSVVLGVYASTHQPSGRPIALFGFGSMIQMKVWLALVAGALGVLQLVTAMWMFGRFGRPAPARLGLVHRALGGVTLLVTLPVAFHCLWALGFQAYDTRVLLHSLAGCLLYGAFVAKVVGLNAPAAPSWLVPVTGGLLFTVLVVVVLTSAVWYLGNVGVPYGAG